MVNISGLTAIQNGTADSNRCYASIVSNNFSQISTAVNSSQLNSDNYGISAVMSQNISTGQLNLTHISNSQVYSSHFSMVTFKQSHVNFASSVMGARFIQLGPTFASLPDKGMILEHFSTTHVVVTMTSDYTASWSIYMTRNPGATPIFSTTPYFVGQPYVQQSTSYALNTHGPLFINVKNVSSSYAMVEFIWNQSQNVSTQTLTFHAELLGQPYG